MLLYAADSRAFILPYLLLKCDIVLLARDYNTIPQISNLLLKLLILISYMLNPVQTKKAK